MRSPWGENSVCGKKFPSLEHVKEKSVKELGVDRMIKGKSGEYFPRSQETRM